MFHNRATLEHRPIAVVPQRSMVTAEELSRNDASGFTRQRLAAERALDKVLADSFPASDPPSWTLGVAHSAPTAGATIASGVRAVPEGRAARVREAGIEAARMVPPMYTFPNKLLSLAGAVGLVLLAPFAILLVGLPFALLIRGVLEAARWLGSLLSR